MRNANNCATTFLGWAVLFSAAFTPSQDACAQGTGSLAGTVIENYCRQFKGYFGIGERGAADVTVLLGEQVSTQTDADGSYLFEQVPAGTYTVGAFVQGFGEVKGEVTIVAGKTSVLDLHLPFAVPGEILIEFADGTKRTDVEELAARYGLMLLAYDAIHQRGAVRIPKGRYTDDFIQPLLSEPIVSFAERNWYYCLLGNERR